MTLLWGDIVPQDHFLMWPCHHQHMPIKFLPGIVSSPPYHLQNCVFEGDILLFGYICYLLFLNYKSHSLVSLWQTEGQRLLVCHWDSAMSNSTLEPLSLREIRELLVEVSLKILRECQGSGCSSAIPSHLPPQAMDAVNRSSGKASWWRERVATHLKWSLLYCPFLVLYNSVTYVKRNPQF